MMLHSMRRSLFRSLVINRLVIGDCRLICSYSSSRILPNRSMKPILMELSSRRLHLSRAIMCTNSKGGEDDTQRPSDPMAQLPDYVRNHVFLSDMPFYFLPNFWKSIRNRLFEILIRGYYDHEFSIANFIAGAEQAVLKVSAALADGDLKALEEMDVLSPDLTAEIKENLAKMPSEQFSFMRINPEDVMRKFIYEIGVIIDDQTGELLIH